MKQSLSKVIGPEIYEEWNSYKNSYHLPLELKPKSKKIISSFPVKWKLCVSISICCEKECAWKHSEKKGCFWNLFLALLLIHCIIIQLKNKEISITIFYVLAFVFTLRQHRKLTVIETSKMNKRQNLECEILFWLFQEPHSSLKLNH